MKNLKLKFDQPYFSAVDLQGQQCVFIGGLYTPTSEEQRDYLLTGYKAYVEEAGEKEAGVKPDGIEALKEHQTVETLKALDDSANVSTSEAGKIVAASSKTMEAVVAGVTPTIKIPAK